MSLSRLEWPGGLKHRSLPNPAAHNVSVLCLRYDCATRALQTDTCSLPARALTRKTVAAYVQPLKCSACRGAAQSETPLLAVPRGRPSTHAVYCHEGGPLATALQLLVDSRPTRCSCGLTALLQRLPRRGLTGGLSGAGSGEATAAMTAQASEGPTPRRCRQSEPGIRSGTVPSRSCCPLRDLPRPSAQPQHNSAQSTQWELGTRGSGGTC